MSYLAKKNRYNVVRHRTAKLLCGLFPFIAPAFLVIIFLVFIPGTLEQWIANYTETFFFKFQSSSHRLSPNEVWKWWGIYSERVLIETLARTYNILRPAFAFSAGIIAIFVLLRWLASRRHQNGALLILIEIVAAFFFFGMVALISLPPKPLALVATLTLLYAINFPLGIHLTNLIYENKKSVYLTFPLSLAGITHLFFPSALFVTTLRCFNREPIQARRLAILLGRICVCGISIPLLSLMAYSMSEIVLSPKARLLIPGKEFYDIVIDRSAGRLLVTKNKEHAVLIISLDRLAPLGEFMIPSAELEDIEFDPARREIYHVDRHTGHILVVDADTFKVLRAGKTTFFSSGSTKIALDKSSNKILISWENNNLFEVDRDSLECALIGIPGNINPLADEVNGIVYINSESGAYIQALDLKHGRALHRVSAPKRGERMALSRVRQELFVPDPAGKTVWVYSTPGLNLLRKIPVQFGVRPIAIDDEHGLLITASIVTGYLELADIATGKLLQRHYVGKYGRIIQLDTARRRAFITLTRDGLSSVDY